MSNKPKHNRKISLFLLALISLSSCTIYAQVTIGSDNAPVEKALLEIKDKNSATPGGETSTTGGFLLPRVSLTKKTELYPFYLASAATTPDYETKQKPNHKGLLVYNIKPDLTEDLIEGLYIWDGEKWLSLSEVIITGDNGVNITNDSNVRLGGELVEQTTITLDGNQLKFDVTSGKLTINDKEFVVINSKIGIGTDNPLGYFHIDAAKDNDATPTLVQIKNDIIVSSDGKIGIAMKPDASDASQLQIDGPLTVKNAGEAPQAGVGYVLSTDDGSGQAKWKKNVSITPTIIGVLGHDGTNTDPEKYPLGTYSSQYRNGYTGAVASCRQWTGAFITLPPGRWIVQSNILLYSNNSINLWCRLYWSDVPYISGVSGFGVTGGTTQPNDFSADVEAGRMVSGYTSNIFGLAVGTTLINNSGNGDKTYFLNIGFPNGGNGNWIRLGAQEWAENGIVAFPVSQ